MILYHGSNVEIEAIDFSKSKPGKDFGVGFYLSPDENQALEMAEKKARLLGGASIGISRAWNHNSCVSLKVET